jgi:uncharacterized protein (DUF433 family)
MSPRIIDRGRGPEIERTRVTVYRIMDFVREGSAVPCIAKELGLTEEQVQIALDYLNTHRASVDAEYDRILQRVQQRNTAEIEAGRATSVEDLKQRIWKQRKEDVAHVDTGRQ